jgi:toxin ParE1/3/4
MAHRLAPAAEADLDEIWLYVAKESGGLEIANGLIDAITDRILAISRFPYIGRSREEDLGSAYRSLSVGEYVIVYQIEDGEVLVLRIVHGRRRLEALFE